MERLLRFRPQTNIKVANTMYVGIQVTKETVFSVCNLYRVEHVSRDREIQCLKRFPLIDNNVYIHITSKAQCFEHRSLPL